MIRTTFEIWSADLETLDNGTVTICSRFFVLCKYQTTFCTFIHVKELKRNGLRKKEKSVFCFLDSYKILCCGHTRSFLINVCGPPNVSRSHFVMYNTGTIIEKDLSSSSKSALHCKKKRMTKAGRKKIKQCLSQLLAWRVLQFYGLVQ